MRLKLKFKQGVCSPFTNVTALRTMARGVRLFPPDHTQIHRR